MARIELPDPSVVVLVGAAGAGKSTFATARFARDEVLSSDAFRAAIGADEADQTVTRAAFAALHRALERRLAAARTSVVDATNVQRHARLAILRRAKRVGIPVAAIVLDLPDGVVLARNAARSGRTVDEGAVRRQLDLLRRSLDGPGPTIHDEGFRSVTILRGTVAVDTATIVRIGPDRR